MTAAELAAALKRWDAEGVPGVCVTPRYRLGYTVWGPPGGVPLVFVHGMNDLPRSFAPVTARLADAGVRCVAYRLPEGGADDANLGMYRHPHFAADLLALLDHLGVGACDLFGSSFGSTVALRTAATHPGRVRLTVLQGGFARRPLHWTERGLCRLGRYWFGVRMGDLPFREREMRKREGEPFAGSDGAAWRFLLANTAAGVGRACALRSLMLDRLDLRPLLGRVRCPVRMVGGDRDGIVPRWCEAEVEAGVPEVRRVEFAGGGHYPQYTHVAATAAEVARFLPLKPGPDPA